VTVLKKLLGLFRAKALDHMDSVLRVALYVNQFASRTRRAPAQIKALSEPR
jgi:hypothetical protein